MPGISATIGLKMAKPCLQDDAFDYVLCKDSYHHMPRPMIALYQMLRVARRAVVLIEPPGPVGGCPADARTVGVGLDHGQLRLHRVAS